MPFPAGSSIIRLTAAHQIKPFDCGDADLNEFLLNDAKSYGASLSFYEKNGFRYLTTKDKDSDTRLMYFDLMTLL